MICFCMFLNLFLTAKLLITHSMLISRKVDETILAIVLAELAQRAIRHAVDAQHFVWALVDVAHLHSSLQVGHLLL